MRRIILGGLGILGLLLGPIAVPAHADTIKLKPTITISADPGVLDPEHPTATVSGQVKVADNGTDQPVAGLTVNLGTNSGWGSIASAVTDNTGHFTSTLIPTTEDSNLLDVFANTPETDTYIAAYADTLEVKLNRAPTRVALTASRTQSDEGQPVGVTGGVEWQSATGWKPAVGVAVTVWASASGCWPNGTPIVKTDSTGHFAAQLTLPCTATIYARAHGPVYQTTDGSVGPITVRQLVHFQSGASIDTNGNVWVGGSVNIDYQTGSFAGKPLNIQYSTGDGTWRTIKRIKFTDNGYGVEFWYGRSGYWRAVFLGDGGYVGATSPASKAWRWNTRFEKFKVSPHKVRKNRTVAVRRPAP
jgi:hypothetical protein